ncbi:hypothetical protein EDC04DRAFT_3145391 [Pisolithus marmoratus]|nr:hypothetical protein EDC04DRAFT_3145391 [Pisolithus marmoratus]
MDVLLLAARTLLLTFVALKSKSTSWRLIGYSAVVALLAADLPFARTGNRKFDYLLGSTIGSTVLLGIRLLLVVRPLEEYRHEADEVPVYRLSFIQRYFWLFNLSNSPRGVGWSFKAGTSIIPVDSRHKTRASFIASRLRWLFSHYLLLEVATLYMRSNPVFLSKASVTSQGYILQCLNVAAIPCQLYAVLTCIHCVLAILAVGAGLDKPWAWPQPFGHWKNAYTVRNFWGKTWHQFVRHDLIVFGPHRSKHNPWDPVGAEDSSATKQEREPWATKYRRLCHAFICSALIHGCGDIVLQFREWNDFSSTSVSGTMVVPNVIGYSAPFFLLQPVGVLVEDAVAEVGKRMGLKEADGLKNALQARYLTGEGMEARATLIEIIADRVFGIQLALVMSSWFSRM